MYRFTLTRAGVVVGAALLAAALAPAPAFAAKTEYYAGSTSPTNAPMMLQAGKSKVTRIAVQHDTACFAYTSVLNASALRSATIDRRGRFKVNVTTNLIDSPRVYWAGERYPDRIVEQFTGTFKKGSASGTVRATLTFLDGSTCTTGTQRWLIAHKPGRVYGGLTNQSQPVTVELSSSGAQIKHLHIGWIAPCDTGGATIIPDFLTNFDVVGGKVDASFTQQYPLSDGGVITYAYQLSSVISKTKVTGSLAVTVSATDAAGAVVFTCTAPTVRWTANS
jgi:hypothetical protein